MRDGDSIYAIPEFEPERIAPTDQLRRVMGEWVAEITSSGPIVVVRTPPGCAHVVASALDRSAMTSLIGTVAGDDTILCVASESAGGAGLAKQLSDLAGLTTHKNNFNEKVQPWRRSLIQARTFNMVQHCGTVVLPKNPPKS